MPRNITLSISDELTKKMDAMPEINWSEVCRQAISKYIEEKSAGENGELLKELGDYLSKKPPTSEEKQKTRKEEIERFTKKWGTPYIYPPSTYTETTPPYVELERKHEIKYGTRTIAKLWIRNSRELAKRVIELEDKDWGRYTKEVQELYGKEIQDITEYFKSKGFIIAQDSLTQPSIALFVTDGDKNQARDLQHRGYSYFALFATDKEDYVFIAYREVKPR